MPRTSAQNEAIKARRKADILNHALLVFSSVPYDDITVDHITKSCECSHGLFYHYFTSKESVFKELYEQILLPSEAVQEYEAIASKSGLEGLRELTAFVGKMEATPTKGFRHFAGVFNALCSYSVGKAETDIRERFDVQALVERFLSEAQKEGHYAKADVAKTAQVMLIIYRNVLWDRFRKPGKHRTVGSQTLLQFVE